MIDLLIPSRGRYNRLLQTLQSVKDTVSDLNGVHAIIFLDEDDAHNYGYLQVLNHTTIIKGGQDILSKHWNNCFNYGKGRIVMHGADDIVFEGHGWDKVVEDFFSDNKIKLLYGKDGHQDKNCATHSFTLRMAADIVGYFLPPYFRADGNDIWLQAVYEKLGESYYDPSIITRHLHVNVDSKYDDDTYKLGSERRQEASMVFEKKKHEIDIWVEKLRNG